MKIILIVISLLFVLFIIIQTVTIMSTQKAERRKYTLVHSEEEFEIRFYPAAIVATIHSQAKTYQELSGPGFRTLAGYIFGGNTSETKIPMTSPVQMDINDSLSEMSFVMPSEYSIHQLPKPIDGEVKIHQTEDEYVAVINFSGFASDQAILRYSEKLKALLTSKGIVYSGNFRFLGYNPPWQLMGRRNEIIVSVTWENK